jgi:hypothetical protein
VDLRGVEPAAAAPGFAEAADRQAYVDLRNHHRNASIDAESEPMRSRKRNRFLKNLDAMRRVARYLADSAVDRFILFNAGIMEYGAAFHAARSAGVTVLEWEQSPHAADHYLLSVNSTHGALEMRPLWASDIGRDLTDARRKRVAAWFASRGRGDWRGARPRGRHVPDVVARALIAQLGLDPDKPVAALFPNITWDTATLDREVAFASVADWALRTAEFFAARPEWQLVVRTHPVEVQASEEFVGEILRRRWPRLPANIRIVEVVDPHFSYRLLDAAQVGLYYTGTLGLEMTMLGILPLTGARPPISGFGFSREAATAEEYFAMVERAFEDPDGCALTIEEMTRAWRFADLYLLQVPKSLPWSYQRFWPSMLDEWPMTRVLGAEGAIFDDVFAAFAGEVDLPDGLVGALGD